MSHLPGSRGFSLQAGVIINLQGLKAWLIGNPSRYIQIEHKVHEKPVDVLSCVCCLDQTCCHHTPAWLKRSNRWTTFNQGGSNDIFHPKLPLLLHYHEPWFSCPIRMFWHNCTEEKVSADKAPTHTAHTAHTHTHTPTQQMQWGLHRSTAPRRRRTAGWRWAQSWPSSIRSSSCWTSSQSLSFHHSWSSLSLCRTEIYTHETTFCFFFQLHL